MNAMHEVHEVHEGKQTIDQPETRTNTLEPFWHNLRASVSDDTGVGIRRLSESRVHAMSHHTILETWTMVPEQPPTDAATEKFTAKAEDGPPNDFRAEDGDCDLKEEDGDDHHDQKAKAEGDLKAEDGDDYHDAKAEDGDDYHVLKAEDGDDYHNVKAEDGDDYHLKAEDGPPSSSLAEDGDDYHLKAEDAATLHAMLCHARGLKSNPGKHRNKGLKEIPDKALVNVLLSACASIHHTAKFDVHGECNILVCQLCDARNDSFEGAARHSRSKRHNNTPLPAAALRLLKVIDTGEL
jgi:hypothetical protein